MSYSVTGSKLFDALPIFGFSSLLALFLLTGCAGHVAKKQSYSFWPDSDLPRIQYLTTINSNQDVVDKKTKFALVSVQDPQQQEEFEPLIKPGGVAVNKGKIYVSDAGRTSVFVIDVNNKTFETLPGAVGRGTFNKPISLAFDDDDNLYVADVNRREVLVFDPFGNFLRTIGSEASMVPTAVDVYGNKVYVLDFKGSSVLVFDRHTGQQLEALGQGENMGPDTLEAPTYLDISPQGEIYTTNMGNGRIIKFDRDGNYLHGFGGFGDISSMFGRPRGITVDEQGISYIVDASHQNVQMFDDQGRLLMFFGGPGHMQLPASVAVTTENLEYFQSFAAPNFKLDKVVLVTNHFGPKRLAIYGLGKRSGIDYEVEYEKIRKEMENIERKAREEADKKKGSK